MFAASKSGRAAGAAPTPTDPSFAYVPLLLNTTSTDGQNNQGTTTTNGFLDSSTNNFTITRNGTPTQGSITPYWPNGQWSNLFATNGDYISVPDAANLELSNSDFQMSAWVYLTAYPVSNAGSFASSILSKGTFAGTRSYEFSVSGSSGNTLGVALTNTGATTTNITGSFSFALNTWYAVRATRVSNRVYLFVNGTLLNAGGTAYTDTISNGTDTLKVGRSNLDATYVFQFFGYVSNVSLAIGGTGYSTANYTPATTPTTTVTSDIKFLSCQSNRFVDNSSVPATVSIFGTPRVQAFQPFSPTASYTTALYGGSGYFNGSTDYLSAAYNAAFNFASSTPLTVEFWFNTTGFSAAHTFISNYNGATTGWTVQYRADAGNVFRFSIGNTVILDSSAQTINSNTWYHFAVVRNVSNSISMYLNGVSIATPVTNSNAFAATSQGPWVGGLPGVGQYYPGYISNLRVANGTAVYTGTPFTPPTLAPLATTGPASAASYSSTTNVNTTFLTPASLLLNMANAGIYDAAVQSNMTTVADAKTDTTIKQWPLSSVKFDGAGDYLSIPSDPIFNLGNTNFTIEAWINPSSFTNGFSIVSRYNYFSGSATGYTFRFVNSTTIRFIRGNDLILDGTTSVPTGSWVYVAAVRDGTTLTLYVSGSQVAQATGISTFSDATTPLQIGRTNLLTDDANGYIQDLRITKGVARTVTTIPTAPFPTR